MKPQPALIAIVIGIFAISIIATVYVGSRGIGRLPLYLGFRRSSYYQSWSAGNGDIRREDFGSAIREYDAMVALRPNQVDGYLCRATAEHDAGLYDRAIADNTKGLSLMSGGQVADRRGVSTSMRGIVESRSAVDYRARLYYDRGLDYAAKDDIGRAIADYESVIALKPNEPTGYQGVSALYERKRWYGLDAANWETATERMPESAISWANRGWAQYQFGYIPEAIVSSRRAIVLDPRLGAARYNLALCYAVTEQWPLADTEYRGAIALKDTEAQTGALQDVRDALKVHPQSQALQKAAALLGDS